MFTLNRPPPLSIVVEGSVLIKYQIPDNFNPRTHVTRKLRDGEVILVDKQILRWRKAKRKAAALAEAKRGPKTLLDSVECPTGVNKHSAAPTPANSVASLFLPDSEA